MSELNKQFTLLILMESSPLFSQKRGKRESVREDVGDRQEKDRERDKDREEEVAEREVGETERGHSRKRPWWYRCCAASLQLCRPPSRHGPPPPPYLQVLLEANRKVSRHFETRFGSVWTTELLRILGARGVPFRLLVEQSLLNSLTEEEQESPVSSCSE